MGVSEDSPEAHRAGNDGLQVQSDFNTGNAIKYLLRKDKMDGNKTKTEKRIEDLRKAVFYIQDEIKLLEHGTD